jgi:hypothetical protein
MLLVLMLPLFLGSFASAQTPTPPWLHLNLTGGPALDAPSYVYDPVTNQLIVYGGANDSTTGCFTQVGDTWYVKNANGIGGAPVWQEASAAGTHPPARNRASAVYDQKNNRMIVFGGASCGGVAPLLQDAWVLENANGVGGATWMPLNPPEPLPAGRAEHSAVYDPIANTMTIFGGCDDGIMDVPNDVWVLKNANGTGGAPSWTPLTPTGGPPAPRCSAVVTYNALAKTASSVMTVYGGCCPSLADLWILSDANNSAGTPAWQQLAQGATAPGARESRAFGYDADINTVMLFGGYSYPGPVNYNDVWMLSDANDIGGTTAWVNTVAENSLPQSPPPGGASGTYDPASKRLMVMQDPADLWVMTTRNGIDVSCSSSPPTTAQLAALKREGILYVVVKVPQYESSDCPSGTGGIERAQAQLNAFITGGFKTAAYCNLLFETGYGNGAYQAQKCLTNITSSTTYPVQLSALSFIALDVEERQPPQPPWPLVGPPARALITKAAETIAAAPYYQRPIIYTDPGDWIAITGTGYGSTFSSYPLWLAHNGVPSLTPFPIAQPFYGWTFLSGKQYKPNVTLPGASPFGLIDLDVFDPSLFP